MISRTYKKEEKRDNPHKVDARQIYNRDAVQIMHIILEPGQSLKPHKTPVDAVFYILEGTATVYIGDESEKFDADSLIESPKEIMHYISNEGSGTARIMVIKHRD